MRVAALRSVSGRHASHECVRRDARRPVRLCADLQRVSATRLNGTPPHPLATDVAGEHRAEPVPPQAHRPVANVDATLEQQILYIAQRKAEPDLHHHHEADHLGRRIQTPGWTLGCRSICAFTQRAAMLSACVQPPIRSPENGRDRSSDGCTISACFKAAAALSDGPVR